MKNLLFWLAVCAMSLLVMIQPAKAEGLVPIENWGNVQWSGEIMWDVSAKAGNCAAAKEAAVNASPGSAPQPSAVIGQQGPGTPYGPHFHVGGTGFIDYYYNWQAPWDPPGVLFTSEGRVYTQAGQSCSTKCPLMSDTPDANGMCTCKPGFQPDASGVQCTATAPPTCPPNGAQADAYWIATGSVPNSIYSVGNGTFCKAPCQIKSSVTMPRPAGYPAADGASKLVDGVRQYFSFREYFYTGASCSVTDAAVPVAAAVPASDTCGAGQSMIQMGARIKCLNPSTGAEVNTNSASAIESAATLEQKRIADALARIASAVAAAGGNASAVADAQQGWLGAGGGAGVGTGAEDPVQAAFCVENPNAVICAQNEGARTVGTAALSTLYTEGALNGGKTVSGVVSAFASRVLSSGIGTAAGSFFSVNVAAGACPVWTSVIPMLGTISFDFYCGSTFQGLLPWIKSVILIIFSIVAFRIAIL